jgi:hypothetical protein
MASEALGLLPGGALVVNDIRKTGGRDFGVDGVIISNLNAQRSDFLR